MIEQVYFYLDNTPGQLVEVLRMFAREGIDMRAYSVAENNDYGVFRMIVRDPGAAVAALRREGIDAAINHMLGIIAPDETGSTVEAFQVLADAGINVRYSYAFAQGSASMIPGAQGQDAFILLRVDDNAKAEKVLKDAGVHLVNGQNF